ncbi:PREDICTED: reverse mRNAase [Prunus dulcis]|uniref:PREDICTED: reverse mRNAase n=1 Tax=Prunus dulcis TaxID=3755 RepID=A0A5E4G2P5_PRUDU|nr:PREDICTED: reverse mRNAase [Prunus dulcis]
MAHETFHYLKLRNSGGVHEAGLKIDMNKAYDRIERDFLEAVMIKMGFARVWIDLIMNCISTVSFAMPNDFSSIFADNALFFVKAEAQNCMKLKEKLDKYC